MTHHAPIDSRTRDGNRTEHVQSGRRIARRDATGASGSRAASRHPLYRLQRSAGNRAVQRLVSERVQPRLEVGAPNDEYEREADRIAETVMHTPEPAGVRHPRRGGVRPRLQRLCPRCRQRLQQGKPLQCADCEERLQRTGSDSSVRSIDGETERAVRSLRRGGRRLPSSLRAFFEPRFGHDFGDVRVHDDERAAKLNTTLAAQAFTYGADVFFGPGRYAPETRPGRWLLAHELAHVAQQGAAPPIREATAAVAGAAPSIQETAPSTRGTEPSTRSATGHADRAAIDRHGGRSDRAVHGAGHTSTDDVWDEAPWAIGSRDAVAQHSFGTPAIQRVGDPTSVPPGMTCPVAADSPPASLVDVLFAQGDASLSVAQTLQIQAFVDGWRNAGGSTPVRVDGFASVEGTDAFNWQLSCDRAETVTAELLAPSSGTTPGIPAGQVTHFAHGETDLFDPAALPPNRRATIYTPEPLPEPVLCGPDVTAWYVNQVNTAMSEPAVLAIQRNIAVADVLARRHGTTAREVAEGGAAAAVVAQETRMGGRAPGRTPTATRQIGAGAASGAAATVSLVTSPVDAALIGGLIGDAALGWRRLVNHGAPYDFKAHVMNRPTTADCPDENCLDSVTICPGGAAENCYLTDIPGNVFYAQIGRFVGWSELTLQLGSQLAQLTGTGAWDPPQDTAVISLGFGLPVPMRASDLCGLLPGARGSINAVADCDDCPQPFPPSRIRRP